MTLFSDRFIRDVDSVWVESGEFPLTKAVAVNTGLRNCAACDNSRTDGKKDVNGSATLGLMVTLHGISGIRCLFQLDIWAGGRR